MRSAWVALALRERGEAALPEALGFSELARESDASLAALTRRIAIDELRRRALLEPANPEARQALESAQALE